MGQETDVLFGFLARAQIADRNGVMRLSSEIDGTQNEFDRNCRAVAVPQFGLDRLVRLPEQLEAGRLLGKYVPSFAPTISSTWRPTRAAKLLLTVRWFAVANHKSLHRGIGKAAHAVGFALRIAAVPDVDRQPRKGEQDDGEARERDGDREPTCRQCRFRNPDVDRE